MLEVCQVAKWQTSYILQTFGVGHVSNNFLRYGLSPAYCLLALVEKIEEQKNINGMIENMLRIFKNQNLTKDSRWQQFLDLNVTQQGKKLLW